MKIGDLIRVKPTGSLLFSNRVGKIVGKTEYADRTYWKVELYGNYYRTYEFLPEQLQKEN